eukprot:TRINITY_DN101374_c0_g1_i1.p1 TRINITY_DN101374_c0_g1~~TRINITY_DN101374_c0_g1_i1.p1  ORF type:complete len:145 (+),score=25.80 TRINITY_DN101374_c0_g1_i1:88-522(+)
MPADRSKTATAVTTQQEADDEEYDDMEDDLPDNWFIRLVHGIAWLLTLVLSILSICFMGYQLQALYVPYLLAKLNGDASYRFPEYFYRVWGNDIQDLTSEHWGYLGACAFVTFISVRYVLPRHPLERRDAGHAAQAGEDHAKQE